MVLSKHCMHVVDVGVFVCDCVRDCMHATRVWGIGSFVIANTEGTKTTIQSNTVCSFGCHIRSTMLFHVHNCNVTVFDYTYIPASEGHQQVCLDTRAMLLEILRHCQLSKAGIRNVSKNIRHNKANKRSIIISG